MANTGRSRLLIYTTTLALAMFIMGSSVMSINTMEPVKEYSVSEQGDPGRNKLLADLAQELDSTRRIIPWVIGAITGLVAIVIIILSVVVTM